MEGNTLQNIEEIFAKVGVVPVIQIQDADTAVPLAKALAKGGLPAAEVTFRTQAAEESIRRIAQQVPEVFVCAGTVLDVPTAERAVKAGAHAVISPGTNLDTVDWCLAHGVPVIPGTATPTEVEVCMRRGLRFIKFFPAQAAGGVPMLKSFAGPYAAMRFMPTGGVKPNNLADFLGCKNVVACGGTWVVPADALAKGDFAAIEALAREAAGLVKQIRQA